MSFDIVIVGGGLSGLGLACELAKPEFSSLKVLVLEQRACYVRDRTWSFWQTSSTAPNPYISLVRQRWHRWRVQQHGQDHVHEGTSPRDGLEAIHYCSLDSDAFYTAAQATLAGSNNVQMRLGVGVKHVLDGAQPTVETVDGEVFVAKWVFDVRPKKRHSDSGLVQQFLGVEIHTARDVFDSSTVELMDFRPSAQGLHFFYVLPYSPRVALVETTWISPASFKPEFESELAQFIETAVDGADYKVVYREQASLNLDLDSDLGLDTELYKEAGRLASAVHGKRVVALGRRAGTLRASTGYAFLETLVHSQRIAQSLSAAMQTGSVDQWLAPSFVRAPLDQWMDDVFLHVLSRNWLKSSGYFMHMFERTDAATMTAFLSGRSTLRQRLRVAMTLSPLPFIRQAVLTSFARLKRKLH